MRKLIAVALLPFFLAGCTVGPKYKKPAIQTPANFYTEQQATANSAADLAWWDLFKDPMLQGLIREAFKNNYDLQLAFARVEQERALAGVARSQYFPQVGYGEVFLDSKPFLFRTILIIPTTSAPSGKSTFSGESANSTKRSAQCILPAKMPDATFGSWCWRK